MKIPAVRYNIINELLVSNVSMNLIILHRCNYITRGCKIIFSVTILYNYFNKKFA